MMADIPGFFDQFAPPPEPPPPVLDSGVSKGFPIPSGKSPESPAQRPRRVAFTVKDWQFLAYLTEFPEASNGQLAKVHGTTLSAASLRVKRLAKMGLIEVAYESWQDTGKVNRRTVDVKHVPEKPWSPE